jgi:hypothetical protein
MDREREAAIQQLGERCAQLLREQLPRELGTLDEIEQQVAALGQLLKQELKAELLRQVEQPAVPADNQPACPTNGKAAR